MDFAQNQNYEKSSILERFWEFITSPRYTRTLSVLALLIIATAIPLTVILSQQEQDIRQRAAQVACDQYSQFDCARDDECIWNGSSCQNKNTATPTPGGGNCIIIAGQTICNTPTPGAGGEDASCTVTAECRSSDLTCNFPYQFLVDGNEQSSGYEVSFMPDVENDGTITNWEGAGTSFSHTYSQRTRYTAETRFRTPGGLFASCRTTASPGTAGGAECTQNSGRPDGCQCSKWQQCAGGGCLNFDQSTGFGVCGFAPTPTPKTYTDGQCRINILSGSTNLQVDQSLELEVEWINKTWSDSDKRHNEVDWYEIEPDTGDALYTRPGNELTCAPTDDALGEFELQCSSVRGQSDECGDDNEPCLPRNLTTTWTAEKQGTTIISAHPFVWEDNRGSTATNCHQGRCAGCQTSFITVGDPAQPTSTPRPTTTPIPTITPTPRLTTTPMPTSTPGPTPTLTPGGTQLSFDLYLQGVGNSSGDNPDPRTPQRQLLVQVFDGNNNQVGGDVFGPVTFDETSGLFTGIIDMGTVLTDGIYTVKVKTERYLRKLIPGIQTITAGENNNMTQASLVVGDINNDNRLDIIDYNAFLQCYNLPPDQDCVNADLNDDDDVVDGVDYNYFIRSLSVEEGD